MPTFENIPYGRQSISEEDVAAVVEVLRSDFLTQGPAVPKFESAVATRVGAKHGVAVNSATSALHLACLSLGLGPGDELWTTPNTFVASANCGLYCGAGVDFVDIDPATYNLSVEALEKKLELCAAQSRKPKVLVAVHFAGQPCDMPAIRSLADRYGFAVIEDASHALGAELREEPTGNCRYSDITIFSFHPVKILTTGEGGMAVTNHDELAQRMNLLRSHGITRDAGSMESASQGPWYYEQIDLGFNYRMTDIQAALGLSQMQRLNRFIAERRRLAGRYDGLLAGLPLTLPARDPTGRSAWHLYVVRLQQEASGKSRKQVFEAMRALGIGVNVHYIPVHTQPHYRKLGFKAGDFPQAEEYYAEAITLPLYYGLTDAAQDRVVACLREVLA